eukprot:scaffold13899_cov153-Amphora_coffeaeformis.AAC.7
MAKLVKPPIKPPHIATATTTQPKIHHFRLAEWPLSTPGKGSSGSSGSSNVSCKLTKSIMTPR